MFKVIIFWVTIVFFFGCSSVQGPLQTPNPNAVYRYDLQISIGSQTINGVGVIKASDDGDAGLSTENESYQMKIDSKVDVDLFTVTSCHRDFSVESAINVNWLKKKRSYGYTYNPAPGIEDVGSCLVRIGSYNKDKGANAWAIIDFETPEATLTATNYCDGSKEESRGVSICQSRKGLTQILQFSVPVDQAQESIDPKCRISHPQDGMNWKYSIAQGECVMAFMESAKPHRIHRHTTVGYSDILIRGN